MDLTSNPKWTKSMAQLIVLLAVLVQLVTATPQSEEQSDKVPETVYVLYLIASILSLIGAGVIMLSYITLSDLRVFPYNIVFILSFCDFCFALKFFFTALFVPESSEGQSAAVCFAQAAWAQFWGLGSVSWNGIIALNIVLELQYPFANMPSYVKWYHLYVWSLCLGTTFVLMVSNAYGVSGDGTCWISEDATSWWQLLFFAPLFAYFIVSITCLIVTLVRTRDVFADDLGRAKVMRRMALYVVAFISFWSVPMAHRICQGFDYNPDWLAYLDALCVSGQGFVNAFVWLSNPFFYNRVKKASWVVTVVKTGFLSDLRPSIVLRGEREEKGMIFRSGTAMVILHRYQRGCATLSLRIYYLAYRNRVVPELSHQIEDQASSSRLTLPNTTHFDVQVTYMCNAFGSAHHSDSAVLPLTDKGVQGGFKFKDYSPMVYQLFRALDGIDDHRYLQSLAVHDTIQSLERSRKQAQFSEGKSGSIFIFTPDRRYMIKTITAGEALLLSSILMRLYQYISDHPTSFINRIYGCHSITTPNGYEVHVVVLRNVFHTAPEIHERYDLKGSWDRDLTKKVDIGQGKKDRIVEQLQLDAAFFRSLGIIDYSLLVGIYYKEKPKNWKPTAKSPLVTPARRPSIASFRSTDSERADEVAIEMEVAEDGEDREDGETSDAALSGGEGMDEGQYLAPEVNEESDTGIESVDGTTKYYIGMIDVLQLYDCSKRTERCCKILTCRDRAGISVQPPGDYAHRFVQMARDTFT